MASADGYRSPAVQSAADSFELRRDEYVQKAEPDNYRRSRPRGNSNAVKPNSMYPPVDNVVNHVSERSDTATQLDPALVAQITEQVINNLKASGIGQQQQPPLSTQTRSAHSRSPADSAGSFNRPYTPPSPMKDNGSYRSLSPEPPMFASDPYNSSYDFPQPNRSSSDASPIHAGDSKSRPGQVRTPSTSEETVLEKAWQPLFQSGQPTPRLSQFLRGLALHIIDDYEPKRSLVIPPAKMAQFFEDVRLPSEIYPWRDIFGGRVTCESISRIYRDLRAQHHFIQLGNHSVPDIPALTPEGFNKFMTILIQAHPSLEYDRLAKAVLDMPISNADNPKERFPKELSRRLLPKEDDITQQQRLHAAMSNDRNLHLRSSNPMPPPPPPPPVSTQPQQQPASYSASTSFAERERAPYSNIQSAPDDDDLRTVPGPIERERQPYTAKEGSGKVYDDDRRNAGRSENMNRTSRANSAAPEPQFGQSRPTDIPGQRHHRLSATGQRPNFGTPPHLGYPPNPYSRSEGTNISDVPSTHYSSNMHSDDRDRTRYTRRDDESREAKRASWYPSRGYDYDAAYDDKRKPAGGSDGYGSYSGYPSNQKY